MWFQWSTGILKTMVAFLQHSIVLLIQTFHKRTYSLFTTVTSNHWPVRKDVPLSKSPSRGARITTQDSWNETTDTVRTSSSLFEQLILREKQWHAPVKAAGQKFIGSESQLTYADTVVRLLSTSRSPRRSTQQEWTTGNHGNNCSWHLSPMNGRFLPLSHGALEEEVRTGSLKHIHRCKSYDVHWHSSGDNVVAHWFTLLPHEQEGHVLESLH